MAEKAANLKKIKQNKILKLSYMMYSQNHTSRYYFYKKKKNQKKKTLTDKNVKCKAFCKNVRCI